ncbi:MAG: SLC13 family permease, partial [Hyphomicrobiales bacterium]|nr:SLC13 family permease [Hyphomicrobiales bacterium]
MTLRDLEGALNESDGQVVGLVRKEVRIPAPSPYREVRVGDILAIEADPTKLPELLSKLDL